MTATITCPHCRFSKEIPVQALPPEGTSATCPKCQEKFLVTDHTVTNLLESAEAVVSLIDNSNKETVFSTPVKFNTFLKKDNRFKGKGIIRVIDDRLEISGIRNRLFSRAVIMESYPLSAVMNLNCSGNALSFVVPLEKGNWNAVLVCDDEKTANMLFSCLPVQTDSNFYTPEQANQELENRVAQISGGTPAVWTLLTLNCLIYLFIAFTGKNWFSFSADLLALFGGNFSPVTTEGQWWRMLTATFLHGGLLHLALNMYALYSFGVLTEKIYGTRDFILIYLLAGFAGSSGTLLFSPASVGVGASGAIFGVMGAMMAFLISDRTFLTEGSRKQLLTNFAIYGTYSLLQGFSHAGIDNAAHIGGGLAGFTLGWSFEVPAQLRREEAAWLTGRLAAGLCVVLLAAGAAVASAPRLNVHYKNHVAMVVLLKELLVKERAMSEEIGKIAKNPDKSTTDEIKLMASRMKNTYEGLPERLKNIQPGTKGLLERKELLLGYISAKVEVAELLAAGAERNDSKLLEEARKKIEPTRKQAAELLKPVKWHE